MGKVNALQSDTIIIPSKSIDDLSKSNISDHQTSPLSNTDTLNVYNVDKIDKEYGATYIENTFDESTNVNVKKRNVRRAMRRQIHRNLLRNTRANQPNNPSCEFCANPIKEESTNLESGATVENATKKVKEHPNVSKRGCGSEKVFDKIKDKIKEDPSTLKNNNTLRKAIRQAIDEVDPELKKTSPELYKFTVDSLMHFIQETKKIEPIDIDNMSATPKEQLFDTWVTNMVAQYLEKVEGKKYSSETEFKEKAQAIIEKVLETLQETHGDFFGDDQAAMILYVYSKALGMMITNDDGTMSVDENVVDDIMSGPGFGGTDQIDVETLKQALEGKVSAEKLEKILNGELSFDEFNEIILDNISVENIVGMANKYLDALIEILMVDISIWELGSQFSPKLEIFQELKHMDKENELIEDLGKEAQKKQIEKQQTHIEATLKDPDVKIDKNEKRQLDPIV